jgi:ABC-2 type transport system permease protein
MENKKLRGGSNAVFYSLFVLGILVLVNIISSRNFKRIDLTDAQIYTISQSSKDLVASLPDRMTVKAFISSDLPARINTLSRYLRDVLEEYATYSNGKLVWEVLDPAKDDKDGKIKAEARRLKVEPIQVTVVEKSKRSAMQAYFGVSFQYGGKIEPLPIRGMDDLEYQISSIIYRLTTKKKKVGFTTGHGEPPLSRGLAAVKQALVNYDVAAVDLKGGAKPVADDIDILITVGPNQKFAPRAKYEIDQYLMKGKPWALFVDGMVLEVPRGQFGQQQPPQIARANGVGLNDQLQYYGVRINEDLVFDAAQNAPVMLPAAGRRVVTNYPGFPIITDLEKTLPITSRVKGYVPVFGSSLTVNKGLKEGTGELKATVLARSSDASWQHKGFFLFNPLHIPKPGKIVGPFDMAVELRGKVPSFFAGKAVPPVGDTPEQEDPGQPSGAVKSPADTRIVLFGDSDMIKDQYLRAFPNNLVVLQNAVDYLAQDETLIAIRAKGQTRRPFSKIDDDAQTLAKLGNIAGLPLAFILFGLLRWRWRRNARNRRAAAIISSRPAKTDNAEKGQ